MAQEAASNRIHQWDAAAHEPCKPPTQAGRQRLFKWHGELPIGEPLLGPEGAIRRVRAETGKRGVQAHAWMWAAVPAQARHSREMCKCNSTAATRPPRQRQATLYCSQQSLGRLHEPRRPADVQPPCHRRRPSGAYNLRLCVHLRALRNLRQERSLPEHYTHGGGAVRGSAAGTARGAAACAAAFSPRQRCLCREAGLQSSPPCEAGAAAAGCGGGARRQAARAGAAAGSGGGACRQAAGVGGAAGGCQQQEEVQDRGAAGWLWWHSVRLARYRWKSHCLLCRFLLVTPTHTPPPPQMRRQEKLAAAQARDEQARRQAAARLEQGAARGAAVAAERQEVAVLARVKHERREAARRLAQSRAEQEAAERAAFYLQRQQQKEAELRQRNEELAELRALKQRERRLAALHAKCAGLWGWRGRTASLLGGRAAAHMVMPACNACQAVVCCLMPPGVAGTAWSWRRSGRRRPGTS